MSKEAKNNVIPQEVLERKRDARNLAMLELAEVPMSMPANIISAEIFGNRLSIRERAQAGSDLRVADPALRLVYERERARSAKIQRRHPNITGGRVLEFPGAVE